VFPRQRALEILEEEANKGWRDAEVTSRFVRLNKRVLDRIGAYSQEAADTSMQDSLSNLQQFLAS
jgi:ATP-dependent helicase/DNAse subunit B